MVCRLPVDNNVDAYTYFDESVPLSGLDIEISVGSRYRPKNINRQIESKWVLHKQDMRQDQDGYLPGYLGYEQSGDRLTIYALLDSFKPHVALMNEDPEIYGDYLVNRLTFNVIYRKGDTIYVVKNPDDHNEGGLLASPTAGGIRLGANNNPQKLYDLIRNSAKDLISINGSALSDNLLDNARIIGLGGTPQKGTTLYVEIELNDDTDIQYAGRELIPVHKSEFHRYLDNEDGELPTHHMGVYMNMCLKENLY